MQINGRNTVDISHTQAIGLIRKGGSTIELVLKKGNGKVPDIGKFAPCANANFCNCATVLGGLCMCYIFAIIALY